MQNNNSTIVILTRNGTVMKDSFLKRANTEFVNLSLETFIFS